MPEKPKAPAPRGVAWDPDIYNALDFVNGLNDLRAKPGITMVPPVAMEQLARLARARVVDNEVFRAGITFSVEAARKDFPLLSTPVYRQELIDRIEKVEEAARRLQQELQTVENPVDRISLWAGSAIRHELTGFAYTTPLMKSSETGECEIKEARDKLAHALAPYLRELSVLIGRVQTQRLRPFIWSSHKKGGRLRAPAVLAWRLLDSSHTLHSLRSLPWGTGL